MIMAVSQTLILLMLLAACCLNLSTAITERIQLLSCDGIERRIIAAHITTGSVRGKLECYFVPQKTDSIFRIRINALNLKQHGAQCPSVKFIGYTTKMLMPEANEDWIRADRRIQVPADPETLAQYDCKNYLTATGKVVEARKTGQKLVMEYDTKNINDGRTGDMNFIVSSYISGPSYNCPAKTFRCWATRHVCISDALECDGVDNCYDNSDEDNFKCTGKIIGMRLPLFIVVMVLILVLVIAASIGIILVCRRRKRQRQREKQRQMDAMNHHGMNMPYYVSNSQTLSPETANSRTNLA